MNKSTFGEKYKPQVRPSTVILRRRGRRRWRHRRRGRRRRNLREVRNLLVFQLLGQNVEDGGS